MAFSLKETGSTSRSLLGQAQERYRTQLVVPIEVSESEGLLERIGIGQVRPTGEEAQTRL